MEYNNKRAIAIFKITLWPMRLIMYATAAFPYEFNIFHNDVFRMVGYRFWLLIVWRVLHQMFTVLFVAWISMIRLHRYHEVVYNLSDEFSNSIDMVSYGTLLIIYLIVYWENTWKAFYYGKIFRNFDAICFKLQDALKINVRASRLRKYAHLLYGLLGIYFIIIFVAIYIRYLKSLNAIRLLVSQYCDIILKLKLIEFALLASIVMVLQIHLNCYTMEYIHQEMLSMGTTSDETAKRLVFEKFAILQDIHRLLVNTVTHIEDYFTWSLPGLLLKMFFDMVHMSYWIYFSAEFKVSRYFQLYGYNAIILQLIIIFATCYICSKCELLDKEFTNAFHMMKYERHNPILRSLLNEISLQLLHEQVSFTAGGFVDINYRFFGRFIFSAICYIVILIQFHMSV